MGIVAAVQEQESPLFDNLEMHKDPWIGAINLSEDRVKQLRQMFKCAQCCTNDHTLPSCPLMKNWIIKRKAHQDNHTESDTRSQSEGNVNSVLVSSSMEQLVSINSLNHSGLS